MKIEEYTVFHSDEGVAMAMINGKWVQIASATEMDPT